MFGKIRAVDTAVAADKALHCAKPARGLILAPFLI